MKKSDMLGKIWEVLYRNTDLEEEGLKKLSEQVLQTVEDNGMVPPIVYNQGPRGYFDTEHYTHEWEEE